MQIENKLVNHRQWCSSETLWAEVFLKLFFITVCPFSMGRIHFLLFKCAQWGENRSWKEEVGLISWCCTWNASYSWKLGSSLSLPTAGRGASLKVDHDQVSYSEVLKLCIQPGESFWERRVHSHCDGMFSVSAWASLSFGLHSGFRFLTLKPGLLSFNPSSSLTSSGTFG